MQKILNWVLAAILIICGASVMTSCSSSEDNAAQGDGHTGVYTAIQTAVNTLDQCLGEVVETARKMGYETIITADHGNADHAINDDGTPNTTHSTNPVPFIYVTDSKSAKVQGGALCDVAPSILHIMGLQQPEEMTGKCLIQE